jgi:hypothetical protein
MKHFNAPWGASLILMSVIATSLCLGITIWHWQSFTAANPGQFSFWTGLLPMALAIGCALFIVRGYTVTPDTLIIQRPLWQTRIPLAELQSAESVPHAMRGSIRTFGNGGFFSFTGSYRNQRLGAYRAFVTDPHRTVVLRIPKRTIVVSPESPEDFVRELARR